MGNLKMTGKEKMQKLLDQFASLDKLSVRALLRCSFLEDQIIGNAASQDLDSYKTTFDYNKLYLRADECSKITANDYPYFLIYNALMLDYDKSSLLTCLVLPDNVDKAKQIILKIGNSLVDLDATSNWQAKFITNKCQTYYLLNLFLTNNNYPQLVHLGSDCKASELSYHYSNCVNTVVNNFKDENYAKGYTQFGHTNKDADQVKDRMDFLTYLWEPIKPHKFLSKQIVKLDNELSDEEINKTIDKIYDQSIHYLKHYDDDSFTSSNPVPIRYLTPAIIFANFNFHKPNPLDLKQFVKSEIGSKVMNYLAQSLV